MRRPNREEIVGAVPIVVVIGVLIFALCCSSASAQSFTDLPPLSAAREVRTEFEDGLWHHKPAGTARDNTGDGTGFVILDGDARFWVLVMRMGTPPPGGAFWTKPYFEDSDPYENWGGNTQVQNNKSLPGISPYSNINIDTWHGFQYPTGGDVEWFAGVKPGWLREWAKLTGNPDWENAAGVVFSIQRSTQHNFTSDPSSFTRYPNELWLTPHIDAPWEHPIYYPGTNSYWGGVGEGAVLVDTYNFPFAVGVGFYTAKTREAPDAFGVRHRSRIGRYAFYLDGPDAMEPVRLPVPGPESYVFSSMRDGAAGDYGDSNASAVWGTANTILQMSVFFNPYDGLYHLLCWGKKPNTKGGETNRSVGLAHYWSPNQGLHWVPDSENPLFTRATLGWPDIGVANQMNSPHGYIDPWAKKGYVFFWGNPEGRTNKVGTRLWCMEFDL